MFDIGSKPKRAIGKNKTCKFLPITITKLSHSTITEWYHTPSNIFIKTRPEVSEADPQRNKSKQKVTKKGLICQVSIINPEISSSTAICKT